VECPPGVGGGEGERAWPWGTGEGFWGRVSEPSVAVILRLVTTCELGLAASLSATGTAVGVGGYAMAKGAGGGLGWAPLTPVVVKALQHGAVVASAWMGRGDWVGAMAGLRREGDLGVQGCREGATRSLRLCGIEDVVD